MRNVAVLVLSICWAGCMAGADGGDAPPAKASVVPPMQTPAPISTPKDPPPVTAMTPGCGTVSDGGECRTTANRDEAIRCVAGKLATIDCQPQNKICVVDRDKGAVCTDRPVAAGGAD